MAAGLNQLPTSLEPLGRIGGTGAPVLSSDVWYKFFKTLYELYGGTGGSGSGGSAILDTIGSEQGGMLARFATGWAEFVATNPNSIPVLNPGADVALFSISELLDLLGATHGDVLFRGAAGWEVLAPDAGKFFQSQGPGADPLWAAGLAYSVATGLAATGTVQADALPLTNNWNEVTTTPAGTGVVFTSLGVGRPIKVWNAGANALLAYPPAGGQIDALALNNPYSIPVNRCQEFDQLTATRWRSTQLG